MVKYATINAEKSVSKLFEYKRIPELRIQIFALALLRTSEI